MAGIPASDGAVGARVPLWTRDFVVLSLTNLVLFTSFQSLMPTMPLYIEFIGGSEGIVGLVTGVFTISALLVRLLVGRELDRRGRRGIYLAGLGVFFLAVVGYNWAPSVAVLIFLRLLHGLGWGATTTAAGTIVADIIPPARRGEGMGYYGMFANLAMTVAPAMGLALLGLYGFSTVFYVSGALSLLSIALAAMLRIPPLTVDISQPRPAFFEHSALFPSVIAFFITLNYGGVITFLPLYGKELGILNIGPYFTVSALALLVTRPFAGIIYDRRGPGIIIVPGMLLIIAATLVMAQAQGLNHLLFSGVLFGLGFGAVQPTLQAMTVSLASPTRRGAANATFFSAFDLGIGLGAMLLGLVAGKIGFSMMFRTASLASFAGLLFFFAWGWFKTRLEKA